MTSELFGRQRELAAIESDLERGERWLTLVGPPGIGKSRLAQELVQRHSGTWVSLADATSEADVIDQTAAALALPPDQSDRLDRRIAQTLRQREPRLVVFDNVEQLFPAADALMTRWRRSAPDVPLLATSTRRLGVEDERVIELLGLEAPDAQLADLATSPGVALFLRKAELAGVDVDTASMPFVAQLVRELDGMPLAIELAAGRLTIMNARALLHRAREQLAVLARQSAAPRDRHRSLQAA